MPELSIPLVHALGFTLGCAAIHGLRDHAERVTDVLALTMITLGLLLLVVVAAVEAPPTPFDADKALQFVP